MGSKKTKQNKMYSLEGKLLGAEFRHLTQNTYHLTIGMALLKSKRCSVLP